MENVANSFMNILTKNNTTIMITKYVMVFMFLVTLAITFFGWAAYLQYQEEIVDKKKIKTLSILSGSFSIIMVLLLLTYVFHVIKHKVGPGGIEGEYNMYILNNIKGISTNFWLFLLLLIFVALTALSFVTYKKVVDDEIDLAQNLTIAISSLVTIVISGWILYSVYLAVNVRSTGLYKIVYQLNKNSPDVVKVSTDFRETLQQKGVNMGIDFYQNYKEVIVQT